MSSISLPSSEEAPAIADTKLVKGMPISPIGLMATPTSSGAELPSVAARGQQSGELRESRQSSLTLADCKVGHRPRVACSVDLVDGDDAIIRLDRKGPRSRTVW